MGKSGLRTSIRRRAMRVALCCVLLPVHAAAQTLPGHFYLGASVGSLQSQAPLSRFSRPPQTCPSLTAAPALPCSYSTDDDATSVGIFGGYQLNDHVAVEIGYADLPDTYSARLVQPNIPSPAFIDVQQDTRALSLRGVFTVALNDLHASWSGAFLDRISLSGLLGVARWRSTANMNVDLRGFLPAAFAFQSADKRRDSGNSFTIGARVGYDITESVRVGVAWDRYTNLGGSPAALIGQSPLPLPTLPVGAPGRGTPSVSTVTTDVDVYSVQLVYRFR